MKELHESPVSADMAAAHNGGGMVSSPKAAATASLSTTDQPAEVALESVSFIQMPCLIVYLLPSSGGTGSLNREAGRMYSVMYVLVSVTCSLRCRRDK